MRSPPPEDQKDILIRRRKNGLMMQYGELKWITSINYVNKVMNGRLPFLYATPYGKFKDDKKEMVNSDRLEVKPIGGEHPKEEGCVENGGQA